MCLPTRGQLSAKISANMSTDTWPTDVDWHNYELKLAWHVDWYLTDMLTEYRLIVSTNTWLWGAQVMKNLTSLQLPLSSLPKVAIVERFNCIQKFPGNLKLSCILILCSFALSSISYFFFRQTRITKICLERGWGRSSGSERCSKVAPTIEE